MKYKIQKSENKLNWIRGIVFQEKIKAQSIYIKYLLL